MLVDLLGLAAALLAVSTAGLAAYVLRQHHEKRGRGPLGRPWPVPAMPVYELDRRFAPTALGPARATEIAAISNYHVPGGVSDFETWILMNLAKDVGTIFEFGTATGKTTYLFARNAPDHARIATLTLAPDQVDAYRAGPGDDAWATRTALQESRFDSFYYSGTEAAAKITQLFGDSKAFDETPYVDACDLVFVDGGHAYSYVRNDTEKALRMVKRGGLVLWHDYRGPRRIPGVFRALNELARDYPLTWIEGTALVAYRRP